MSRQSPERVTVEIRSAILVGLVFAAVAEMVLLRLVYRVGIHVPRSGPFLAVYGEATEIGLYAFNLAALLAVVGLLTRVFPAPVSPRHRLEGMTCLAIAGAGILAILTPNSEPVRLVFLLAVDAALALFAWRVLSGSGKTVEKAALIVAAASAAAYQYYAFGYTVARSFDLDLSPMGAGAALRLSEVLALLAAAAFYVAWGPRLARGERRWLAAGAIPGLLVLTAELVDPWTTSILALWAAGFTLALPAWAYAVALALFLATVGRGALGSRTRLRSIALLLLLAAGIQPTTTYQYILLVVGFGLLTDSLESTDRLRPAADEGHHPRGALVGEQAA